METETAEGLAVQAAATVGADPETMLIMEGREAIVVMTGGAAGALVEGTTTLQRSLGLWVAI